MSEAAEKQRVYTYGDIMEWDDGKRWELYDGVPVALASPTNVHQEVLSAIHYQLYGFLRGKPCKVYPSPFDVRLFDTAEDRPEQSRYVLQPDLMVVCDREKVDRHGVHGAPDLVIEILSPSSRGSDRLRKFVLYERAGVREYWLVDPEARTVEVYLLKAEEGRYYAADAVYTAGASVPVTVLEGCSVDLREVFPDSAS